MLYYTLVDNMKKSRKYNLFFSAFLIFSLLLGSLPVSAFEENTVNIEQPEQLVVEILPIAEEFEILTPPVTEENIEVVEPIVSEEIIEPEKSEQIEEIEGDYVEGEVLVKYAEESEISVLEITDEDTVAEKIAELENDPNVEYAEPNYTREITSIVTNDTHRGLLWGLDNTAQIIDGVTGTNDADIDAPEAWAINEGTNASVTVAVIDTGVLYTHPDLTANMWDGTNCKNESGVAIVGGCNHGYDYLNNDNTPLPSVPSTPSTFHGTHVAGIIGGQKNNDQGVIGVAPNVKIMAIKFGLDVSSEVKAIDFATQNGVKVINASYGGAGFSQPEFDAISRFKDAGGIFIAASGNNNANNDATGFYPASYDLDNIISVAATDQNDLLANFSNYGATSIDVGAPGTNIYSTVLSNGYDYADGTSMATPHVTGLVALLWGYRPSLTATEVKDSILDNGDNLASLAGKTVTGKRINAFNTLNEDITAPVITLLGASPVDFFVGDPAYIDAGATALDDVDGDITANIVVGGDVVDINLAETYVITYNVSDTAGNTATEVTRTINVIVPDTTAPIITLNGANPMNLTAGDTFTDPGATALDDVDGAVSVVASGVVDTAVVDTYTISYAATDVAFNTATATRTVNVNAVPTPPSSSGGGGGGGGGGGKKKVAPLVILPSSLSAIPNGCVSGNLFSPITGAKCPTSSATISGCVVGNLFSSVTGAPCGNNSAVVGGVGGVLGAEAFQFTLLLKLGSRGPEVMELQKLLNNKGYDCGVADGTFGQKTKNCVALFQISNGLPGVGIVGPMTRATLNK